MLGIRPDTTELYKSPSPSTPVEKSAKPTPIILSPSNSAQLSPTDNKVSPIALRFNQIGWGFPTLTRARRESV